MSNKLRSIKNNEKEIRLAKALRENLKRRKNLSDEKSIPKSIKNIKVRNND